MKYKILIAIATFVPFAFTAQMNHNPKKRKSYDNAELSATSKRAKTDTQETLKQVLINKVGKTTIMEYKIVLGMVKTETLLKELLTETAKLDNALSYVKAILQYEIEFIDKDSDLTDVSNHAAGYAIQNNNFDIVNEILKKVNDTIKITYINRLATYAMKLNNFDMAELLLKLA